jgi:hypothetical protein
MSVSTSAICFSSFFVIFVLGISEAGVTVSPAGTSADWNTGLVWLGLLTISTAPFI